MKLHELSPAKGSTQSRKRVGRGPGSGLGKTSGKGHKGQKSRASYRRLAGFEGGQMSLVRRVPKRGFNNVFRVEYEVVNVGQIAGLEGEITPETLVAAGLVKRGRPVKVLGDGEATKGMSVVAHKFSKTAKSKIEAAGGRCQEPGA